MVDGPAVDRRWTVHNLPPNLQKNNMITREEWLNKARDLIIEQVFKPYEVHFAPIIRVSVGLCPGKSIGVCCDPNFADDGAINIFITPEHGDKEAMEILSTLTHELVHAANYSDGHDQAGHGHQFKKIAYEVGLEGRPKSCGAKEGSELYTTLSGIYMTLGEYPHAPLHKKEKKTRQSEMITYVSETDEEYTVKLKFSQVYEKGAPRDFNDQPMKPKDQDKWAELEAWYLSDKGEEET